MFRGLLLSAALGAAGMFWFAGSLLADTVYQAKDTNTHAFWLPGADSITPGTYYRWVLPPTPELTVDGTSWSTATDARLAGRIISDTSPASIWTVDLNFTHGQSFHEWVTVGGHAFKNENNTAASDYQNWRFFEFDSNVASTLTHVSGSGGSVTPLEIEFYNKDLILQVGIGASMKQPNDVLGASAWIVKKNGVIWSGSGGHGDINIELMPVPLPLAVWPGLTLMVALGGLRLCRRRQCPV